MPFSSALLESFLGVVCPLVLSSASRVYVHPFASGFAVGWLSSCQLWAPRRQNDCWCSTTKMLKALASASNTFWAHVAMEFATFHHLWYSLTMKDRGSSNSSSQASQPCQKNGSRTKRLTQNAARIHAYLGVIQKLPKRGTWSQIKCNRCPWISLGMGPQWDASGAWPHRNWYC